MMTILLDVLKELVGMFLADFRLTAATLVLVAGTAVLIARGRLDPSMAGWVLLGGCLAILVGAVLLAARAGRKG